MTTTLRGIRSDKLRDLARDALDQGFRIDQTGSGHPVLVSPSGDRVWFSTSTSSRDFHGLANCRAGLIRAGYVPRDRRPKGPLEPSRQEVEMIQPTTKRGDERGGFTFVSRGRAVSAEDVTVDGQPFRIRVNGDGSINATTLRRSKQRSWQRKDGDRDELVRTLATFVQTVDPWEVPTIEPERKPYVNGHARAEVDVPPTPEPEPTPEPTPDPTPEPEPAPSSTESDWPGLDEHVDRPRTSVVVSAFVDLAAYPIAIALDELDRIVSPAVEALEAAGKPDVADLVRGELAKTPAEAELLALYREVMSRPRLDRE